MDLSAARLTATLKVDASVEKAEVELSELDDFAVEISGCSFRQRSPKTSTSLT